MSVTGREPGIGTNRLGFRVVSPLSLVAIGLAVLNVVLQIGYPLTGGSNRRVVTIASVVVFFCASLAHCVSTRSWRSGLALVMICVGGGLAAESIGWRTGWPFGNYRYGTTLGPKLLGVPMVVPLAWAMMGWPALLAGRRVGRRFPVVKGISADESTKFRLGCRVQVVTAVVGSLVLSSWDLFLDPQMVGAGHWRWLTTPGPWLNGIPLVNTVGWFIVGMLMVFVLDRAVPNDPTMPGCDTLMWVVLAWVWFSNIVGQLVFFRHPMVALAGGVASSVVALIVAGKTFRLPRLRP